MLFFILVIFPRKNKDAAKQYILANGGIEKTHMFAKVMLAITGQYVWPPFFPIPLETILLPTSFPINFYSFSVYGRAKSGSNHDFSR